MIFFPIDIVLALKEQEFERDRWGRLSNDQKVMELRQREVRALERQASALEERNRVERNKFF